jgi:hypothetical protein
VARSEPRQGLPHDILQTVSLNLRVLCLQPLQLDPLLLQELGDLLKFRLIGRYEPR